MCFKSISLWISKLSCSTIFFLWGCLQRNLLENLLNQAEIRLYLPCTDWFGIANGHCPFAVPNQSRKMVNKIRFRFDLMIFFCMCTRLWNIYLNTRKLLIRPSVAKIQSIDTILNYTDWNIDMSIYWCVHTAHVFHVLNNIPFLFSFTFRFIE